MAATPLFLVTDVGLAAASVATPTGPYIHITSFKVGSAYGYEPQRTDTDINGALLYEGVPTTYQYVGDNTLNIVCKIPPDAGPFNFGEVALFLDGGAMFAKAVFDTPQTKYSSLGTNILSTYIFNCLLKLEQSVAVFKVDTIEGSPSVWEVDKWSDVYPAGISANPDIPTILVREASNYGDSSFLTKTDDENWTVIGGYKQFDPKKSTSTMGTWPVANASTTWIEIAASLLYPNMPQSGWGNVSRLMVVKTEDGFFRSVASIVTSGSNYRFNLNPDPLLTIPPVGSQVRLYLADASQFIYYDQIVDPPAIPLATAGTPGLARAGNGLIAQSPGVIGAAGLLHGPGATATGRLLTGADSLNVALPSGVYHVTQGFGYPAGMPASWGGQIYNVYNTEGVIMITQLYIPATTGGGDGNGVGGVPMYWRSYYPGGGYWCPWYPLSSPGKVAPGSIQGYQYYRQSVGSSWSETNTTGSTAIYTLLGAGPSSRANVNVSVDGNSVTFEDNSNPSWSKTVSVTVPVKNGSTIRATSNTLDGAGNIQVSKFVL